MTTVINIEGKFSPLTEANNMFPTIKELKKKLESCTVAAVPQHYPKKVFGTTKVKEIVSKFENYVVPVSELQTSPAVAPSGQSDESSPSTIDKFKPLHSSHPFFVPEHQSVVLTVKQKVQLYEKFVYERSKKNQKFVNQAEVFDAIFKKSDVRHEVVNEIKVSVKDLRRILEANCSLHNRILTKKSDVEKSKVVAAVPSKARIFEHLGQPIKTSMYSETTSDSLTRWQSENKDDGKTTQELEPSSRMKFKEERQCYLPPRKRKRTQDGEIIQNTSKYFRSVQLNSTIANWLSKRRQKQNGANDKPTKNRFLEKIIAKFETKNSTSNQGNGTKIVKLQKDQLIQSEGKSTDLAAVSKVATNNFDKPSAKDKSVSDLSLLQKPPENELQKSHDHNPAALSEHQLRIQASLQRLNIPDWFRQYNQNQKSPDGAGATGASTYKPGNFTRKRTQDSGRWVGLNSKTTSLSSLGSQRSDRSPLLLSPSAHSHHGGQSSQHAGQHGGHASSAGTTTSSNAFSRWSTSHLNSSHTSPSVSQRGSFSRGGPINSSFISVNSGHSVIRNSMRQPYLGWRSQEKLSQRTAHERLASSLLSQQQRTPPTTNQTVPANNDKLQPVTPEIQSSIKEVTSAIVHYVNDQTNQQRSRSTSPNSRKCWLESSFVGARPLGSPQTPIIENTPLIVAAQAAAATAAATSSSSSLAGLRPPLLNSNNNNINNTNNNNNNLQNVNRNIDGSLNLSALTGNEIQLSRMNGGLNNGTSSSSAGGVNLGVERSLSNASLEDVLASLLGLPTHQTGANASDAYARSSTGGALVSESQTPVKQNQQQKPQHHMPQKPQPLQLLENQQQLQQKENLLVISKEEQQRLRRRSEGDAATKQKQQQQLQQHQQFEQKSQHYAANAKTSASDSITSITNTSATANGHAGGTTTFLPPRRVSLGDSSESNNRTASASGELQIKCRNNKCDRTATPADAKKYYKSCHNCTYLYCSRECRRAHWEKHRKACLHSRVSNLCRQVLAACKDDSDSLRHLSLLARKGFLSQGRGVVRILFRSPEAAEGFIKNGFQCMGEASYVRWPDLMPAEMGLELYSELLKLSTEYRPDSKMLVYVAVCVVSEAPGMGQAPVRWERQLVSRCAKLKLCKTVLAELEQQQQPLPQPVTVVAVPEPTTEVLILTFNPQLRTSTTQRELVLSNILDILSRRGVILRKHYPEIYQRLQTYTEGQTDKFNPVTLHPRDSHTGQNFVCIIMPVQSETEIIKLPSIADGGNRVTSIDVGSSAALAQLDDDELLTRTTSAAS